MSLFISLLGIILIAVFFFAMNQNITGVISDVETLQSLSDRVETQESRLNTMEEKVAAVSAIPSEARRMILAAMLEETAQRAAYLSKVTDDEGQATKLQQARKLIEDVQKEMSR